LVILSPGKKAVGCKWVYTVKLFPDGTLACIKARLIAKGYSHVYGLNYVDTFCHAPLPKIRGNGVATRVGDVYTREKYPTYIR